MAITASLSEAATKWSIGRVDFSKPIDSSPLKNANVFITGGASGLGLAFAERFARAGAYVTIGDLNDGAGRDFETSSTTEGLHVKFVHCDVTDWSSLVAAFKAAIDFAPRKRLNHVLANACALAPVLSFPSLANHDSATVPDPHEPALGALDSGLIGVFYTAHLAAHYLTRAPSIDDDDRSVLFTDSVAGYSDFSLGEGYAAAKWGVRGLFKALRGPFIEHGIRLNNLVPTSISTPMAEPVRKGLEGAGIVFAPIEHAVDAVERVISDENIHGRAFLAGVNGPVDFEDDTEGDYGVKVWRQYVEDGFLKVVLPGEKPA